MVVCCVCCVCDVRVMCVVCGGGGVCVVCVMFVVWCMCFESNNHPNQGSKLSSKDKTAATQGKSFDSCRNHYSRPRKGFYSLSHEQQVCPVLCALRLGSNVRIDQGINFLSHVFARSTLSQVSVFSKRPRLHEKHLRFIRRRSTIESPSISDKLSRSQPSQKKQV